MNDLLRRMLALPVQGSSVAASVDRLHYVVIGVTMAGWLGVTLAAVYFTIRYRRRAGETSGRWYKAPLWLEAVWTAGLLVMFLLWWAVGFRQYVRIQDAPGDAMVVYATGKQWMWEFAYPDGRSSIAVLTVPLHRKVKLVMTSRDVIHSFYVPSFRVKQDVLPGRYTTLWFEATVAGEHPIYCAEYCGLMHSQMWGEVRVLTGPDYDEWLRRTPPPSEQGPGSAGPGAGAAHGGRELVEQGREVAVRYGCASCHRVDGVDHLGPSWRGLWRSVVTLSDGEQVVADEAYLTESMMDPAAKVVRGYEPLMPAYQGVIGPAETGALLEYIKSLRDTTRAPEVVAPRPVHSAGELEHELDKHR